MKWVPDSLFGRLLVAVTAPIAVMLVVSFVLVIRDRQMLARRLGGTTATVEYVATLAQSLAPLEGAPRTAAIRELNALPPLSREPPPRDERNRPSEFDKQPDGRGESNREEQGKQLQNNLLQPLREKLGANCRIDASDALLGTAEFVDLGRPPRREKGEFGPPPPDEEPRGERRGPPRDSRDPGLYDVTVTCVPYAPVIFRVPAPMPLPGIDARLAWQLLFLTLMLGVVLYFTTRRLTRPLVDLQRAAQDVGRALTPPRLQENGALEIRETLRAFNTMHERLRRYLDGRTRVLASMSHDLRTPLTRLRLRAESIEDVESRKRLVADIEEMDALVNRSLALFRQDDSTEVAVTIDINSWLATLLEEFTVLGKHVALRGRIQKSIITRPLALKRAVSNLVDNALKYGGDVEVELASEPAPAIFVRDRGPGIPDAELEKVFEPFHRVETSRNRQTGGVGLGLSIARETIEQLGGALALSNRSGGGLQAKITLPRA